MHISQKMDKELQRLLRALPLLFKPHRRIPNRAKYIRTRGALPAVLPKDTVVGRVVIDTVDVVEGGGPAHVHADFVGPGGDGCEVALGVGGEDGA